MVISEIIKGNEEDSKGLSKGTFTFKLETKITTTKKNKTTGKKAKNPKLKRERLYGK